MHIRTLGLLALLALPATQIDATDLTVRFTGQFVASSCSFTVSDLDLGTYQAPEFTGSTMTPWKQTTIARGACTADIRQINMNFQGAEDSTNPAYFAAVGTLPGVSETASGVAIQLQDQSNADIRPGGTMLTWPVSMGSTYTLRGRLVQTRPTVTAGSLKAPVTIQITYN
nr:fimbrial protein [Dyella sp. ASV24]